MSAPIEALRNEVREVVGPDHLRPATPLDAVDGVQPRAVVEPGSAKEMARVLRLADSSGLSVAPRGGGTKLGWGNPPRCLDLVFSTSRLERIIEHAWADMTATVESGCTVARFQEALAQHGQRLAIDPLWPERATIGGILATNDSGTLRLCFGSLRDLIIGMTIALPNGTLARSGGKVVKNVAGYDLPKLLTGSFGTLGVITEATFRLHPLPRGVRSISFNAGSNEAMDRLVLAVLDSALAPAALQIRARSDGPPLRVDVRFEGVAASLDAQTRKILELAEDAKEIDGDPAVWDAREALWAGTESALVCKVSVLPAQLGALCYMVQRATKSSGLGWKLVVQAVGVGLLRVDGKDELALSALSAMRSELKESGGSLVILHCPPEKKEQANVWGETSDALPLMIHVKEQFDPGGTLNPGRFVGGI